MKQGFTLLELSIVLVIVGLIIGGITVGADMIRSAELQSVVKERSKLSIAINSFTLKYNALPGDMKNATDYWGEAHATSATCKTTETTSIATCNGDGNGKIDGSTGSYEWFRFWQHLKNADLIQGTFDSVPASAHILSADDSNSFNSTITNAGWAIYDAETHAGNLYWFAGGYGATLILGGYDTLELPRLSILTPQELYQIDIKFDDGKPAKGSIIAKRWNDCTDAITNSDIESNYLLSADEKLCAVIFKNVY